MGRDNEASITSVMLFFRSINKYRLILIVVTFRMVKY